MGMAKSDFGSIADVTTTLNERPLSALIPAKNGLTKASVEMARAGGQTSNSLLGVPALWNDCLLRLPHSLNANGFGRLDELAVERDHRLAVAGLPEV